MDLFKIFKDGTADIFFLTVFTTIIIIYMVVPLWGL